jgi:hypothetical protein
MKVFAILVLLNFSSALAFAVAPPRATTTTTTSTRLSLFKSVEDAIAEAQRICAENPDSQDCKVAWDIVEELEAADSHKGGPEAPTVLSANAEYNSLLDSFDILAKRTADKLEQLKAVTLRLEDLGVTDPRVTQLYDISDELKQAIAQANAALYNE